MEIQFGISCMHLINKFRLCRSWRSRVWLDHYLKKYDWVSESSVMQDEVLSRLVKKSLKITEPADIKSVITWAPLNSTILNSLTKVIVELNQEFVAENEAEARS